MASNPSSTAPGYAGHSGAHAENWSIVVADDGHMFIATAGDIVCHQDPNHAAGVGDEWDLRNFRLIAAAPEVVEHAKRVMALLAEHGPSIVSHLLDSDDFAGQRLRTALAKAEGRADV